MINVINTNNWEAVGCSKTEAGRIIGVSYKTINEWSKAKDHERYNHFIVVFNFKALKQVKGFKKNHKKFTKKVII